MDHLWSLVERHCAVLQLLSEGFFVQCSDLYVESALQYHKDQAKYFSDGVNRLRRSILPTINLIQGVLGGAAPAQPGTTIATDSAPASPLSRSDPLRMSAARREVLDQLAQGLFSELDRQRLQIGEVSEKAAKVSETLKRATNLTRKNFNVPKFTESIPPNLAHFEEVEKLTEALLAARATILAQKEELIDVTSKIRAVPDQHRWVQTPLVLMCNTVSQTVDGDGTVVFARMHHDVETKSSNSSVGSHPSRNNLTANRTGKGSRCAPPSVAGSVRPFAQKREHPAHLDAASEFGSVKAFRRPSVAPPKTNLSPKTSFQTKSVTSSPSGHETASVASKGEPVPSKGDGVSSPVGKKAAVATHTLDVEVLEEVLGQYESLVLQLCLQSAKSSLERAMAELKVLSLRVQLERDEACDTAFSSVVAQLQDNLLRATSKNAKLRQIADRERTVAQDAEKRSRLAHEELFSCLSKFSIDLLAS